MKPVKIDPKTGNSINKLPTSDEVLKRALEHPPGSEERRSYIKAALMLERRPRGRPKGKANPQIDDSLADLLMWCIARDTGVRAAERLARLAVDTGLLVDEKATYWSSVRRLAKRWQRRLTATALKRLDEQAAERGHLEDADTVVHGLADAFSESPEK